MDASTSATPQSAPIVFILDCDNTLLDNDRVKTDMDTRLKEIIGDTLTARFWQVYEEVRKSRGTVDLPDTFVEFRAELPDDETLERVRSAIMDFPFASRLFPATPATLRYLSAVGQPVIVSDGDSVYQPRKIELSGLAGAVDGQWVVYTHKENHLDEVMRRWPADFYVMVDDKARILAETKRRRPDRFVTVHILKGHYSREVYTPAPDITLNDIGGLQSLDLEALRAYL
jgi:FMN phosphatase YigB (HAD superfamily)